MIVAKLACLFWPDNIVFARTLVHSEPFVAGYPGAPGIPRNDSDPRATSSTAYRLEVLPRPGAYPGVLPTAGRLNCRIYIDDIGSQYRS